MTGDLPWWLAAAAWAMTAAIVVLVTADTVRAVRDLRVRRARAQWEARMAGVDRSRTLLDVACDGDLHALNEAADNPWGPLRATVLPPHPIPGVTYAEGTYSTREQP